MLLQYSIIDSVIKSARMHVEKGVPQGGLINSFNPFKVQLCLNIWLSGICGKILFSKSTNYFSGHWRASESNI